MKKTTLWHGTSTGDDDETLRSIFNEGLLPGKSNTQRSLQRAGIHCSPRRSHAAIYAQGEPRSKGGDPLLIRIRTMLDARHWDIDHEATEISLQVLSHFKAAIRKMPPHLLDVRHGDYIHERVSSVRCTKNYLIISGERLKSNSRGKPTGPFEEKVPWTELKSKVPMSAPLLYPRLQALHDYLRETLKDKYTDKLQETLDRAQEKPFPIKYIGPTGLVAGNFYTQPPELGFDARNLWNALDTASRLKAAKKSPSPGP